MLQFQIEDIKKSYLDRGAVKVTLARPLVLEPLTPLTTRPILQIELKLTNKLIEVFISRAFLMIYTPRPLSAKR